jgi:hypothetical protein
MSKTVTYDDAVSRVGAAKFGAEWIGNLTHREEWLLQSFAPPKTTPVYGNYVARQVTAPGFMNYFAGDTDRRPQFPGNDAEYSEASKRSAFRQWQLEEVNQWLSRRDFPTDGSALDLTRFKLAYAKAFEATKDPKGHQQSQPTKNSDEWHVARIVKQALVVRPYVLEHDKDISGPNPEAKVRRLQYKVQKRRL